MLELNSFQKKCEKKLASKIESLGYKITNKKIVRGKATSFAEEQVFIKASIGPLDIWIYADSADVKTKDGIKSFESEDYKRENRLIGAFVDEVVSILNIKQK